MSIPACTPRCGSERGAGARLGPAPTLSDVLCLFFSSRRRHTRFKCDWSSDVCSSDCGRDGQSVTLKQVGEGLDGVNRVFIAVAGEADHEAVADELVVTGTGNHCKVLDARTARKNGRRAQEQAGEEEQIKSTTHALELEWAELVPDASEPAFVLAVGDGAVGNELD